MPARKQSQLMTLTDRSPTKPKDEIESAITRKGRIVLHGSVGLASNDGNLHVRNKGRNKKHVRYLFVLFKGTPFGCPLTQRY
jgi:hypothetical protein